MTLVKIRGRFYAFLSILETGDHHMTPHFFYIPSHVYAVATTLGRIPHQ